MARLILRDVAIMFTAYELAGVFTNLAAGMMGEEQGSVERIRARCLFPGSMDLLYTIHCALVG